MRRDGRDQHEAAIAALPIWTGDVRVSRLHGGITNENFVVTDAAGRFVVRFGDDIPVHGVMRFNELAAARAAHAAGLSPEVVFAAPGVMVSRFLEGRSLVPEDVRDIRYLPRIINLVRRCHYDVAPRFRGPILAFWVFQVIRSYVEDLRAHGARVVEQLPALERQAAALEALVGPVTIVFGHNDLLAANIFDDGERLWLIDWDYAGLNSPLFDLANLASNNSLGEEEERALLAAYFGVAPDANVLQAFEAMKCASLMREALWGAVSEIYSRIDFDYAAYAEDYFARLSVALERIRL